MIRSHIFWLPLLTLSLTTSATGQGLFGLGKFDLTQIQLRSIGDPTTPLSAEPLWVSPGDTIYHAPISKIIEVVVPDGLTVNLGGKVFSFPIDQKLFQITSRSDLGLVFCIPGLMNKKNQTLLSALSEITDNKKLAKYRFLCVNDRDGDGMIDALYVSGVTLGKSSVAEQVIEFPSLTKYRISHSESQNSPDSFSIIYESGLRGPHLKVMFLENGKSESYDWAEIRHSEESDRVNQTIDIDTASLPHDINIGDGVLTIANYDVNTRRGEFFIKKPLKFDAYTLHKQKNIVIYYAY